ncbi:hypothetical protein PSQ19_02505 [Devosia algicola]|uniref:Uncharacterized protein n=1 Tax=Devosia algicola TaxID=3026418 RepID=A0ABY7YP63_9HYPH|nr:hypothetical protein [Devosia algicola]WDR03093.1 hypothetical protein PSQ19_02505 [Devosia algicola]
MQPTSSVVSPAHESSSDFRRRAYAAMRQWGDADRDDEILEGACEARDLSEAEIEAAAKVLAVLEDFHDRFGSFAADFLPALIAEAAGGAENLAVTYGITIPRCATVRRKARHEAIRSLARAC